MGRSHAESGRAEDQENRITWPAHEIKAVPWRQRYRGGTREDRMLRQVAAAFPPHVADSRLLIPSTLSAELEEAVREIAALDAAHAPILGALGALLLRAESVASSRIEEIDARIDDYARALHGIRANSSAVSMADATRATDIFLQRVSTSRRIELDDLTDAHRVLMGDALDERDYAGRPRDMQNWIGGSQHSPRNALYVPPPPETVETYLADLIRYSNRDDIPVLAQAAIAHAQFESIHPFTDGNGRIGRALINGILRRRAVTNHVVVPLASALVAHRDRYFDNLAAYRAGDPVPLMRSFAHGSRIAAAESSITATRLAAIPHEWKELTGPLREHSATAKIIRVLTDMPILTVDDARARLGLSETSVYTAIDNLLTAGVLRPLTDRKRDQVWGAGLVLDELESLGARITRAAT